MKLYHGTSEEAAGKAMQDALHPRSRHKQSNWRHTVESNRHAVYLTDTYPLYFAVQAGNEGKATGRIAIVEIESNRLNQDALVPDEDTLAQINRSEVPVHWSLIQRARYFRPRLKQYARQYDLSLEAMGTCAYLGSIPAAAITRVAFIDYKQAAAPCWIAMNASITMANFRLKGAEHRAVTNWVFGEPIAELDEAEQFMCGDAVAVLAKLERKGIEIVEVNP